MTLLVTINNYSISNAMLAIINCKTCFKLIYYTEANSNTISV